MVCARTAETLQIKDKTGKALKQVENFRYLDSVIHVHGGSEEDIKARIAAAWKKWKELSGVLCDRSMPTGVKGKVYTPCPKKHVTTFSTITLTIGVRLQ